MNGYEEAEKIDKQISDLLNKNPISEENCMEWWRLTRTLRTGLEILEANAKIVVNTKYPKRQVGHKMDTKGKVGR